MPPRLATPVLQFLFIVAVPILARRWGSRFAVRGRSPLRRPRSSRGAAAAHRSRLPAPAQGAARHRQGSLLPAVLGRTIASTDEPAATCRELRAAGARGQRNHRRRHLLRARRDVAAGARLGQPDRPGAHRRRALAGGRGVRQRRPPLRSGRRARALRPRGLRRLPRFPGRLDRVRQRAREHHRHDLRPDGGGRAEPRVGRGLAHAPALRWRSSRRWRSCVPQASSSRPASGRR